MSMIYVHDRLNYLLSVEKYDVANGVLHLRHVESTGSDSEIVEALVQIDHVLDSLQQVDLMTGAWLHIIANVGPISVRSLPMGNPRKPKPPKQVTEVKVDAIVAWNAGSLDLQTYEEALDARIACGST